MRLAALAAACLLPVLASCGDLKAVAGDPVVRASAQQTARSIIAASPKLTKIAKKADAAVAKGASEASVYCGYVRLAQGAARVDDAVTLGSRQSQIAGALTGLAGKLCDAPPQSVADLRPIALDALQQAIDLGWL